jgi:hypothetical protein
MRKILLCALFGAYSFAHAQNPVNLIQEKLRVYYGKHAPAALSFTCNQSRYAPGDTLFFKGHVFRQETGTAIAEKQVVNVLLSNEKNDLVSHARILFANGRGHGYLAISETAEPGFYNFAAYSDAMHENQDSTEFVRMPVEITGKNQLKLKTIASEKPIVSVRTIYKPESTSYDLLLSIDPDYPGKKIFLIVSQKESILTSQEIAASTEVIIPIDAHLLRNGMNRITLFSETGQVLGEGTITTSVPVPMNISLSRKILHTNDSATVALTLTAVSDKPVSANVSVSVTRDDLQSTRDVSAANTGHTPWVKILNPPAGAEKKVYPYYFRASVQDRETGQPVPDSTLVTFYLNDHETIFGRYTQKGQLEFPLYTDFSDDNLLYSVTHRNKSIDARLIQATPTVPKNPFRAEWLKDEDSYFRLAKIKKQVDKSFAFYGQPESVKRKKEITEEWDYDFFVDLKKINPFPTMRETLHDVVPMVQVRGKNDKYYIRIFLKHESTYATGDPLFLIDGVLTDNTDYFLSLPPDKMSIIKVLRSRNKLARFGMLGRYGIIVIESIDHTFGENIISTNALTIKGVQRPVAFNVQKGKPQIVGAPDLRACLYWNPDLTINSTTPASFTFFTGDLTGDYTVHIQGFTPDGQVIDQRERISVEFSKP